MRVICPDGILKYDASLDIRKTMSCGQAFRWTEDGDAVIITAGCGLHEREITVCQQGGDMEVSAGTEDFLACWQDYFDLLTDYGLLRGFAEEDEFFAGCLEYGEGIRVLKQDLWETLITFILSQRSNIPRIRGCVSSLAGIFGHFPTPGEIALSDRLQEVRCGYRTPYLKAAAAFKNLSVLRNMNYAEAKEALKQIKGVGDKVADCVILFGLHNRGAFPVDVWIERIIGKIYSGSLNFSKYGNLSGIVQQYMYFYAIGNKHLFS